MQSVYKDKLLRFTSLLAQILRFWKARFLGYSWGNSQSAGLGSRMFTFC